MEAPFTEISAVNDEADVLVSVSDSLIDHEFELADIIDRPRIELIEEWDPVVLVHGKADIKDRQSEVNLGLPELDKINIPCLTVLGELRNFLCGRRSYERLP